MEKIWSLDELPQLIVGDCLAFRAEGWQRPAMKWIGAETFHWAMVGAQLKDFEIPIIPTVQMAGEFNPLDYQVVDATSKGVTHHLLSEYQFRHMRVYRPQYPTGVQEALKPLFLWRYLYYGDRAYDNKGALSVGIWGLLTKIGFKIKWWDPDPKDFYCLEFDATIHKDFGLFLVPGGQPAYPPNMEKSKALVKIWGTF